MRFRTLHLLVAMLLATTAHAADTRPTWLFFTSASCGPCRQAKALHKSPQVSAWAKQFKCVVVDVDRQPQIKKQYGVTSWPRDIFVSADKVPRVYRPKGIPKSANLYAWRFANAWQTLVSYPLRPAGARTWDGCESWRHLLTGIHKNKFDAGWLSRRPFAEILALHADDHESKVNWQYVVRPLTVAKR